jgi:hypothetical protein
LAREQDPRVPPEVEEYLVGLNMAAGAAGAKLATPIGAFGGVSSSHLSRRGARGGERGARWLRTLVEERAVPAGMSSEAVTAAVLAANPRATRMQSGPTVLRFALPLGRTGLQHVVLDVPLTEGPLRAFGKEGLLNRHPTARTADEVAAQLAAVP